MPACSFNKYTFSSLSLALLSVGLLSCGGGGDNASSGDCLPAGSQLSMVVPVVNQVDPAAHRGSVPVQLFGNGSDVPVGSVSGATPGTTAPANLYVLYRRTSVKDASLDGNFSLATGQYTLPGPIIITTYDTVFVNMKITYNASSMNDRASGTCTGTMRLLTFPNGVGQNPVEWLGTEGTVGYNPSY